MTGMNNNNNNNTSELPTFVMSCTLFSFFHLFVDYSKKACMKSPVKMGVGVSLSFKTTTDLHVFEDNETTAHHSSTNLL